MVRPNSEASQHRDTRPLESKIADMTDEIHDLRKALSACLDAMDMQEKRERGEFQIPPDSMLAIWQRAMDMAQVILGSRTARGE